MSSGTSPAPPTEDLYARQQQSYAFNGRVLLTAVVLLLALSVLFVFVRVLVYRLVMRSGEGGGGGLAAGILRSINSFGGTSGRHGLDASALSALPVTAYRRKEGRGSTGATADCAVCLSELADGEKVRELPNCGHVFHVECVDAWLRSRTTCPLCRAEAAESSSSAATAPPPPPPLRPPSLHAAGGTLTVNVEGDSPDFRRAVHGSTPGSSA